jgi:hypothetical protein
MLLAPVLAGAIVGVLVKVFQKFGIELDAKRREALDHAALAGVLRVKEEAAEYLKRTGIALATREKARRALAYALELAPHATAAEAEARIVATLPLVGEGAAANPGGAVTQ